MQSYSPQELERMQKQAIDRVHEMQRQAKMGAAENRRSMSPGAQLHYTQPSPKMQTSANTSHNSPPAKEKVPPKEHRPPHSGQKPLTPPLREPEKPPTPPPISRIPSRKQATPFLSMDSDTALILPLILLLQKDGADEMLILALLYIMA